MRHKSTTPMATIVSGSAAVPGRIQQGDAARTRLLEFDIGALGPRLGDGVFILAVAGGEEKRHLRITSV